MFKLVSLALGLFTIMTIAPSARSTTAPIRTTQSGINGNLHAQKLMPLKRSTILSTTAIQKTSTKKTLSNRKIELSPAGKESQRIKNDCQPAFDSLNRFGANERPLKSAYGASTNNYDGNFNNNYNGSFNNAINTRNCSFSIPLP